MKKTFTLALVATVVAVPSLAQSIDAQKITFEYVRLPLVPLPASVHTFQPEIVARYEDAVKQQKADRNAAVAEVRNKAVEDKNELNKAKSQGVKALAMVLMEQRSRPEPGALPPADYTPQVYDPQALANTYVNISGLQRAQSAADLRVIVSLDGFIQGDVTPVTVQEQATWMNSKAPAALPKYIYQIAYKSPVAVKVMTKDGTVLLDEQVEGTNAYTQAKTEAFANPDALAKYWEINRLSYLRRLDDGIMQTNMELVKNMLDSRLGQRTLTRKTNVLVVTDKKANYDEYPQAYEKAMMGYKLLGQPARAAEATKQIEEALALWNKALAESNPKDKNARIDAKVTAVTLLNAAEANLWLNNFDEVERLLAKLKLLDFSRYDDEAKDLSAMVQDQRSRYQANHKN